MPKILKEALLALVNLVLLPIWALALVFLGIYAVFVWLTSLWDLFRGYPPSFKTPYDSADDQKAFKIQKARQDQEDADHEKAVKALNATLKDAVPVLALGYGSTKPKLLNQPKAKAKAKEGEKQDETDVPVFVVEEEKDGKQSQDKGHWEVN